jgi:Helix-turn-helix domain
MSNTEFTARKLANVDRAAADQRLSHLDFRLLWLLASAADRKTGIARRKQSYLAEMLGVHRRTVQRCRDRLVSFGYVIPIGIRPGGNVSGYNLFTSKKAALVPPSEKGGAGAASDDGQGGAGVQRGGAGVQKGGPPTAPILPLKSLEIPCAPNREIEAGGPRQRADALGPHPLGVLEASLRRALGQDFRRLAGVKLVDVSAGVVRISVLTAAKRDEIIKHCKAGILSVTGATELQFEFALTVEPPPLRRMR